MPRLRGVTIESDYEVANQEESSGFSKIRIHRLN